MVFPFRQTNQKEDGDGAPAPGAEDFPTLTFGDLPLCVLVPAEVVAVDFIELLDEATTETGTCVGIEPAAVGDVTKDTAALVFDEVGGPSEGLDIGVVEGLVVCGFGVRHISRLNPVV